MLPPFFEIFAPRWIAEPTVSGAGQGYPIQQMPGRNTYSVTGKAIGGSGGTVERVATMRIVAPSRNDNAWAMPHPQERVGSSLTESTQSRGERGVIAVRRGFPALVFSRLPAANDMIPIFVSVWVHELPRRVREGKIRAPSSHIWPRSPRYDQEALDTAFRRSAALDDYERAAAGGNQPSRAERPSASSGAGRLGSTEPEYAQREGPPAQFGRDSPSERPPGPFSLIVISRDWVSLIPPSAITFQQAPREKHEGR